MHILPSKIKKKIEELEMNHLAYLNIMEDLDRKSKELEKAYKELYDSKEFIITVERNKIVEISRLVAGVVHELNNPLTSIIGFSDAILHDLENKKLDSSMLKDDIKIISNNANRCKNLIANLLFYRNSVKLEYIPLDVNKLIDESIFLVENERNIDRIEISREYSNDIPEISANKDQISQVFVNIIRNALQSMEGIGTLKIATKRKEDYINIVFKDTGKGIKREHLGKVFEPFFTTNGSGIGLGLDICVNIIKNYKGEILVESEGESKGATFTIKLPIKRN